MSDLPSIEIRLTHEFKRNLRTLARKFRRIRSDIEPLITQLQQGEIVGDQVSGTGFTIFKVRVRNSDLRKGKRAGYRVIYYLQTQTQIVLLTIYSKTEQGDVSRARIRDIINQFNQTNG